MNFLHYLSGKCRGADCSFVISARDIALLPTYFLFCWWFLSCWSWARMNLGDVCGEPQFLLRVINREGHGRELAEGNTDYGPERRESREICFQYSSVPETGAPGTVGMPRMQRLKFRRLSSRAKRKEVWRHLWVFLGLGLPTSIAWKCCVAAQIKLLQGCSPA